MKYVPDLKQINAKNRMSELDSTFFLKPKIIIYIRVRLYGAIVTRDFFYFLLLVTRDVTNSRLYGVTIPKIFKKIKNFKYFQIAIAKTENLAIGRSA